MKKRNILKHRAVLFLTAFLCAASLRPFRASGSGREEEKLSLYAEAAVLMDADTGRILWEKNGDVKRPMASTTKILTCILALELGCEEDLVEVSGRAASMPDVQLGMRKGERYRMEDLLFSLMLESHNDSAAAIAEHIGGSEEGFAELMNQKAREIGCRNCCFVTPNGLDRTDDDGRDHGASAADMALLMRYCAFQSPMREEFLRITRTESRTFRDESGRRSFSLSNHNAILSRMPEMLTGKTGFTGKAGYCYVAALEAGERHFTVCLLGCGWPPHKTRKWEDMDRISRYAFEQYELCTPENLKRPLPPMKVPGGVPGESGLFTELPEKEYRLLLGKNEHAGLRFSYPESLPAPVRKGEMVGTVRVQIDGFPAACFPICADTENRALSFTDRLRECLFRFFSPAVSGI